MKLELPTKEQLLNYTKWSLYLSVPILVVVMFLIRQDPNIELTKEFISSHNAVVKKVGNVNSISLYRATYVDDAIDYDNNLTQGYNLYSYKIKGAKGTLLATVQADKSEKGIKNVFSIESMEAE